MAETWYVSPEGQDTNIGSESKPFASLARAVDAARAVPKIAERRIKMRDGLYFNTQVSLNVQDCGLQIVAEDGAKPVLIGGERLVGFEPDGPNFWATDLPAGASADFRLLIVNDRLAPRARLPETGTLKHLSEFKVPWMGTYAGGWKRPPTLQELTTLRVNPSEIGSFFQPANAELTIYHEWDESTVGVKSYEGESRLITFTGQSGHPPGAFRNRNFVIWNTRDGMTKPGQWYVDRLRRKVVYWPLAGEDPKHLRVIFPVTDQIINIQGTPEQPVRDLGIEGLTFIAANTPLKAGGFGAYNFDGALTATQIQDCQFRGLKIRQIAGQGIKISSATNCIVSSCRIQETGAGGVLVKGSKLTIADNHIGNVGRIYASGIGITCNGADNIVRGNWINQTPYVGLTCDGFRALIEGNRIEHVMKELHDGAGIYLGGTNHLVRSNLCLHIGQVSAERRHAYYMDEHVRDARLEKNLAIDCPSPLHNHLATNNAIVNNIFMYQGDLRIAFYRCADHRMERNFIWAAGTIEVYRAEAVSVWTNNLFFSGAGKLLAVPVQEYSPGTPKPLVAPGIFTEGAEVDVDNEGRVTWNHDSPQTRLGIEPLDLRSAGNAVR
jgi:hypothetical protein